MILGKPRSPNLSLLRSIDFFLFHSYDSIVDLPIICTLTEDELKERRRDVINTVQHAVLNVIELPLGYAYTFRPTSDVLAQLTRLVDLERQCCKFLTFSIIVESGDAPIRLEVTGPQNAKAVIEEFFGASNDS